MSIPLRTQVTRLQAEVGEYRSAFEALLKTRVELAAAVEGSPSREQLVT